MLIQVFIYYKITLLLDAKPPFKPENYVWTYYNGNPRNYSQILLKYAKYKLDDFNIRSLEYP